jgi:hypothetical protein
MDYTSKITGGTVWWATVWQATSSRATTYLGPNTGPTADATGGTHTTGTWRVRGHPPPKKKLLMDPYLKRYNNYVNIPEILTASGKRMSPPHPSKILPPNGPIFLVLECRFGEMFPGTSVQVCPGPSKKG